MNIASFSIQASLACIAWLESSLEWTVLYSAGLIVNICMFYLFINKDFIHYNTPDIPYTIYQSITQFERTANSI